MTKSLLAQLSLFVVVGAAQVAAQMGPLTPYWPAAEVRSWVDRPSHPGAYGRVVAAQISDFGYPDAVFLAGQDVMLMVAPALFFNIVPLPGAEEFAATDVCAIDRPGVEFDLALCGPGGLALWKGPSSATLTTIVGGAWTRVESIRPVQGSNLLVGMATADERIVFAHLDSLRSGAEWSVPQLLAAAPFDYDGDGVDEIGIVTGSGIEIRDLSGSVVAAFPGALDGASAERLVVDAHQVAFEALCALVDAGGTQALVTVAAHHQELVPLGTAGVRGLVVSDVNADGFDDVSLPATGRPSVDALLNHGHSQVPWFVYAPTGGFEVLLPWGTQPTPNPARPLVTDYDGDGYADLVHPLQANGTFVFNSNPLAPNTAAFVKYTGLYFETYHGSTSGYIRLNLQHDAVPADVTHLELMLYDWNGGSPASMPAWGALVSCEPSSPPTTIESLGFDESELLNGAILGILRYVRMEDGERVHSWPSAKMVVTGDDAIYATLLQLEGVTATQGGVGGSSTGGVGDISQVPPPFPPYSPTDPAPGG